MVHSLSVGLKRDKLQKGIEKAGIEKATRHLLFCLGPDCCQMRTGEFLWEYVKKRVKETGIKAMRTKVGCLRICTEGPWMVVYPEGIWYGQVTPQRFERILQQHLIHGKPVEEWIAIRRELPGGEVEGESEQWGSEQ